MRSRFSLERGFISANTGEDGRARFNITESGRYSAESRQMDGYFPAYLEQFELELCNEGQNGTAAPQQEAQPQEGQIAQEGQTPSQSQQQPPPNPPSNSQGQQGEGKYQSSVPSRGELWQMPGITPEIKQAAKEAAISGTAALSLSAAGAVILAALVLYAWGIRKRQAGKVI